MEQAKPNLQSAEAEAQHDAETGTGSGHTLLTVFPLCCRLKMGPLKLLEYNKT